jgi:hypothetical protein
MAATTRNKKPSAAPVETTTPTTPATETAPTALTVPLVGTVQAGEPAPPLDGFSVGPFTLHPSEIEQPMCFVGPARPEPGRKYVPSPDDRLHLFLNRERAREQFADYIWRELVSALRPVDPAKVAEMQNAEGLTPDVLYSGGEWAGFGAVILAAYPHRREPFAVPFHHPDYGPMVFLCVQTDRLAEEIGCATSSAGSVRRTVP